MRKAIWALPLVVVGAWALYPRTPALADESAAPASVPTLNPPLELPMEIRELPMATVEADVLDALVYWTNVGNPKVVPIDVLRPWAHAIAEVALTEEDAIWMAAQADVESGFKPWVLDFSCNRGGWRACDHGNAVGAFQMWEHGAKLVDTSPEVQVREAYRRMLKNPYAWTTWRAARAQADHWLATHDGR